MSSPQSRLPLLVDLPAGPTAAGILSAQLARADADPATVIAPVPLTGPHVSQELRDRLITAISPDVPIREADGQVVLTTSGSTATAKAVVHSMDAVRSSTRALHEYLGGAGHWLCALPLHTSAGFMTVARAVLSGTVAVPTSSLGGAEPFTSHSFLSACEQMPSTGRRYISLVPAMARRLSDDTAALRALADFDAVLIGGQAVPADLTNVLVQSGAKVVLSYGATETCGGCVYDGHALPGVSVTIGPDNRVIVSGPMVMLGYRSAPSTQRQHHESDAPESAHTRSITMPDCRDANRGSAR
ncbi:MAG: hypothetical protein EB027_06285 [Actinobacteria bacterium]|nr:hypothetical protein [Actinomycetota bacterium]